MLGDFFCVLNYFVLIKCCVLINHALLMSILGFILRDNRDAVRVKHYCGVYV